MNKVYRLVWNRRVSAYTVTSELARGKAVDGKAMPPGVTVIAAVAALAMAPSAYATVTCSASGCNYGASGDVNSATVVTTGNVSLITGFSSGSATQAGAITGFGDVTVGSNWLPSGRLIFTGANTYTGTTHVNTWGNLQIGTTEQAGALPGNIVFDNSFDGTNYYAGNLYFINATGANGQAYDGVISHAAGFFLSGTTVLAAATVDASSSVAGHAGGTIEVGGSASTGSATLSGFSQLNFATTSTAGSATIIAPTAPASGSTLIQFLDQSTAGTAHITSGVDDGYASGVYFGAQASAGTATIVIGNAAGAAEANTIGTPGRNTLQFWNQATADHATIENHNGYLLFDYDATAAQSTIHNDLGGVIDFYDQATAGQATITNGSGSSIAFEADTTGDQATFHNQAGANIDISQNNASVVALGYVDGAGDLYLGDRTLSLGATNADATIGGVIHDSYGPAFADYGAVDATGGSLLKTGTGRLVLGGNNTYTGSTTIQSGTLQLGAGAASGSVTGDIADNGTLAFDRSDTYVFGHQITGSGNVAQVGTGTTVFSTDQTYTGGTRIDAGTLQLGNGGTTGSVVGNIVDNGTLAFAHSGTYAFGSQITGSGGVRQGGPGTTVFTTDQTYTGGTRIDAGTLQLGNGGTAGSIVGDVVDNGVLAIDRASELVLSGNVSGSGALVQAGSGSTVLAGDATYTGGTTIQAGSLRVGNGAKAGSLHGNVTNNGSLVFDRSDAAVFDGAVSGAGSVVQSGSGNLVWNATSTGTGGTTIQSGGLTLGDAAHPSANLGGNLVQASGTTVTGFGRVAGNAQFDGVVAPGDATTVGTLRVDGDATFGATSQYQVKATPEGTSDSVSVGGTATLAGSVLALGQNREYQPSTTYTILSAGNGIVGRYGAVSSNFAFLTPTLAYQPQAVELTLTRNTTPFGDVGTTPNQGSTGTGVETVPTSGTVTGTTTGTTTPTDAATGSIYDAVLLMSAADAREAFTQLSGELHASVRSTLVDDTRVVRNAVRDRGLELGGPNVEDGPGMWTRTLGGNASYGSSASAGTASLHASQSGLLAGADATFDERVRVGVMAGYGYSALRSGTAGSSGNVRTQHLGVYGAGRIDDLLLTAGAGYAWNDVRTTRRITVPGIEQSLFGDYHAPTAHAFAEAAWRMPMDRFTAEPFLNAAVVRSHSDEFDERGGNGALHVHGETQTTPLSTAGVRGDWDLSSPESPSSTGVHASVGWQHAYGSVAPRRTMNFVAGGDAFDIAGAPIARDAAVASVGVNLRVGAHSSLGLNLDGMFAHGSRRTAATANFKVDL